MDKYHTHIMKRVLFCIIASVLVCFSLSAQTPRELIKEKPVRAAGNHNPYETPAVILNTPAPKGYKPFYVSHYGRHGSRYKTNDSDFKKYLPILEEMQKQGLLTEEGLKLANDIKTLGDEHKGMVGVLTLVGGKEHQGIAERLYDRVPEVFNQKDRNRVFCVSTSVHRVIESMGNFTTALKGKAPKLDVTLLAGDRFGDWLANSGMRRGGERPISITAAKDSITALYVDPTRFTKAMFTDPAKAEAFLAEQKMTPTSFMQKMFVIGSISPCLDRNNPDIFSYFTNDELYGCWYCENINLMNNYSFTVENRSARTLTGQLILNDIIEKADDALKGNNRCADLRFGHDTGAGALLALIKVQGYDKVLSVIHDDLTYWPGFKYLNMATNLQLIFYKNKKGDVLVKLYRNENETTIPALKPYFGPYYRWSDLRAYFMEKMEGFVSPLEN